MILVHPRKLEICYQEQHSHTIFGYERLFKFHPNRYEYVDIFFRCLYYVKTKLLRILWRNWLFNKQSNAADEKVNKCLFINFKKWKKCCIHFVYPRNLCKHFLLLELLIFFLFEEIHAYRLHCLYCYDPENPGMMYSVWWLDLDWIYFTLNFLAHFLTKRLVVFLPKLHRF